SLVRDVVAEICESAGDPIVAPRPVLLGHADDQGLDLRADLWPSRRGAHLGSIELAGDQTTVPAENRLRLGDTGDTGEQLPAEPFTDFSKCAPLGVGEPDSVGQVRSQNPVFCDEVFALKEKALIDEARDVCQ